MTLGLYCVILLPHAAASSSALLFVLLPERPRMTRRKHATLEFKSIQLAGSFMNIGLRLRANADIWAAVLCTVTSVGAGTGASVMFLCDC